MGRPLIDLTGQKFNMLTVLGIDTSRPAWRGKRVYWRCVCDCGNEKSVMGGHLRNGDTKSCGCYLNNRLRTHHLSKTKIYAVWGTMKARCKNPSNASYARYGGRGITVCDEWRNDFQSFYDWAMANGYKEGLSIDRIDNNGNYCPENCRWATPTEQANNIRRNIILEYNGEMKSISEWSRILNIPYGTLYNKVKKKKEHNYGC